MTEIVVLDFDHLCDLSRKVVRFKTMFCLIYRHFYANLLTVKNATNFLSKLISMPVQRRPSGSGWNSRDNSFGKPKGLSTMNAEKKNFYGWILLVAIGIMFLCSSGFILVGASVVNPLMMADSSMNMNATLMGLGFTLFVLCQGIPAPLIGQFITKYGQKKTFIVGGLLLIIGGLLMAFVVKTTIGYLIAFGVILSIGTHRWKAEQRTRLNIT